MQVQYPPLFHGRHGMAVALSSQGLQNYDQEWLRDVGCRIQDDGSYGTEHSGRNRTRDKTLWGSIKRSFPLFHERFPTEPRIDICHASGKSILEEASTSGNSTAVKGAGRGESNYESYKETSERRLRRRINGNVRQRFHPDFLVPQVHPDDQEAYEACLQRGIRYLTTTESDRQYQDINNVVRRPDKVETLPVKDRKMLRIVDWFNAILKAMLGPEYRELIHWTGYMTPARSPVITGAYSWGTRDLTFLKEGRGEPSEYTVDSAASGGGAKASKTKDMSWQDLLEQNLKTHAEISKANPLASAVRSITFCEHRMRLWQTTPTSLNSSRLIDMDCLEHRREMLEILLFLSGPLDCVLPRWLPDQILALHDVVGNKKPKYEWASFKKVIYSRSGPCGNLTTACEGQLRYNGICSPSVMKMSYLPEGLCEHELRILRLFTRDAGECFPEAESHKHTQRKDLVLTTREFARVTELIPEVVGAASLDSVDLAFRKICRTQTSDGQPSATLHLTTLVTKGSPEIGLDDKTLPLSMEQLLGIFADIILIVWYSAVFGIDYRDLNLGNIMRRIDSSGAMRGVLVVFGNSLYGRSPRDPMGDRIADTEDDGRSANYLFMTLNSIVGMSLVEKVVKARETHAAWEAKVEANRSHVMNKPLVQLRQKASIALDAAEKEVIQHHLHSYTDNLESLLYCFVAQLDCFTNPDHKALSNVVQNTLGNLLNKQTCWNENMEPLIQAIQPEHDAILIAMVDNVIEKVKTRRTENLKPRPPAAESYPALTDEEHQCFRECYEEFLSAIRIIKLERSGLAHDFIQEG